MDSPVSDPTRPAPPPATRPVWWWAGAAVLLIGAAVLTFLLTAHRHPPSSAGTPPAAPAPPGALPEFEVDAVSTREGEAAWYEVPAGSLPQRRAWQGELTAASDSLKPDTYARVTRLDAGDGRNGSVASVVVRITDDGIRQKGTVIDLNREAAETLGIIKSGKARVRVEELRLKHVTTNKPVEKKDGTPAVPKADQITNQPVASEQQEKDASNARTDGKGAP